MKAIDETVDGDAVSIKGLRKAYGKVDALRSVDLRIGRGEIMALLGPNGAGKSTLMSIVTGLTRPDAGTVHVGGIDVQGGSRRPRRSLGFAGQESAVYPTLTVRDNLRIAGELAGLGGRRLGEQIAEIAEVLLLTKLLSRPARHLSGGEVRRAHTAMALIGRPPVLFLDEPTSGVDAATRSRMLEVIRDLARAGTAICYSTHYFNEVEQLDPSVTVLDRGAVLAQGSLATLVAEHGESVLEMRFRGVPPTIAGRSCAVSGDVVRVRCSGSPATDAAEVLAALGADAERLQAVEFIQPSLESAFLSMTGRRFDDDGCATTKSLDEPG